MSTRKTLKKPSKKRTTISRKTGSSRKLTAGLYTTPSGNVSLPVPPFWTLRQTNDDLQLASPSGDVSLILNAYERNGTHRLDAREYLDRLLSSAPREARVKRLQATARRAGARYKDPDGTAWHVEFLSNGSVLLLSEVSSPTTLTTPEAKTALSALAALKMK